MGLGCNSLDEEFGLLLIILLICSINLHCEISIINIIQYLKYVSTV